MNIADFFNRKENRYAVPSDGRMEAYERAACAHAALERSAFVADALRLVEATRHGPYVADVEQALGCSPFARGLRAILTDGIPPHERRTLIQRLTQINRWQQGWNAQQDAEEATRG